MEGDVCNVFVGGAVPVGGIKKVDNHSSQDDVPMYQCAKCGVRYHLVDDLVKHVEKGEHFNIDAIVEGGHEVSAGRPSKQVSTPSTKRLFQFENGEFEVDDETDDHDIPSSFGGVYHYTSTSTSASATISGSGDEEGTTNSSFCLEIQEVEVEEDEEMDAQSEIFVICGGQADSELFLDESESNPQALTIANVPKKSQYRCLECRKRFKTAIGLKNHCRVHHPLEPEKELVSTIDINNEESYLSVDGDGVNFSWDVLIEPFEGRYRCSVCQKVCHARSDMKKHVRAHSDDRPFSCNICFERFKDKYAITNHLRIHTGEKPFPCIYCGKKFSQVANQRRHENLHRDMRPFQCDLCDRTFSEKTTLQTHMRQHTGERPFVCELCGRGHTTKSALTQHSRRHKKNEKVSTKIDGGTEANI